MKTIPRNLQYYKFSTYGFLKNLKFFDIFFLLFLRETGIDFFKIGILYSIRQITINIFEIPSGFIADTFGRKRALVFSFLAYLISFLIFYLSESYLFYIFAMITFGLGEAFRSGTHKAMILDYLKEHDLLAIKTRYYGGTRSWSQFGSAISSIFAMCIVFVSGGYRDLFLLSAIPYLLDLINISTYPSALNGSRQQKSDGFWLAQTGKKFRENWNEFLQIFKDKRSFQAMLSAASYIAVFKVVKDYLQPILKTTALSIPIFLTYKSEQKSALVIGITYFFIFLLTSTASRNAWRVEEKFKNLGKSIDVSYLSGILSIGISGVLLWLDYPVLASITFVGLYLFQNIRRTLMVSYLSELISSNVMASGLSAESQLQTILIVLYAPVLGWIIDCCGIYGGLIITSSLFILLFPFLRVAHRK